MYRELHKSESDTQSTLLTWGGGDIELNMKVGRRRRRRQTDRQTDRYLYVVVSEESLQLLVLIGRGGSVSKCKTHQPAMTG